MDIYNVTILVLLLLSQHEYSCLAETKVTIHPKSSEVDIGQTIQLECQFTNPVYCTWTRNVGVITISGRYSYTENDSEGTRSDCSIRIEFVDNIDFANWKCYGTPSEGKVVESTAANIKEKSALYVGTYSRNKTFCLDPNIPLVCSGKDDAISSYVWEYKDNTNDNNDWKPLESTRILQPGIVADAVRCTARINEKTIYSDIISLKKVNESGSTSKAAWIIALIFWSLSWMTIAIILAIRLFLQKQNSSINSKAKHKEEWKLMETGDFNRHRIDSIDVTAEQDIVDIAKKINSFKKSIAPLQKKYQIQTSQQEITCEWFIKNVRNTISLHKTTEDMEQMFVTSPPYEVFGTNYSIKLRVYFNGFKSGYGSHVSVGIKIDNKGGEGIFYHKRTIILVDQRNVQEKDKNYIRFQFEPSLNSFLAEKWMKDYSFAENFVSQSLVENSNFYIINDTMKLLFVIEPSILVAARINQFCYRKFEWKINGYYQKKTNEIMGYQPHLNSKDFYLLPWGHRCQVAVHFTGFGSGYNQGISVYFGFMLGIYEEETPSFFPHTMVFTIQNQDKKKFPEIPDITRTRKVTAENLAETENEKQIEFFRGENMIACHDQFEKEPYLVNDSIVLSVTIIPTEESSYLY